MTKCHLEGNTIEEKFIKEILNLKEKKTKNILR